MGNGENYPVFFDPKGWRRVIFRLIGLFSGSTAVVLSGCFLFSIIATPVLPEIDFSLGAGKLRPAAMFSSSLSSQVALDLNHRRDASQAVSRSALRYAFFNHWDENSFASLREHAGDIDVLIPEWLHLSGSEGETIRDDRRREEHVRRWLKKTASSLKVLPLINNFNPKRGRWDGAGVAALVASDEAKRVLVGNLLAYVQDGDFAGVVIDFKAIPDGAIEAFVGFIRELRNAFAPAGLARLSHPILGACPSRLHRT